MGYGRLLGPLLAGYLLFDRAFAYVHLPGTPLYIGEMVLAVGIVGVLTATGYIRIPLRDEPILALLAVFTLWGLVRAVPGIREYGMDAVRDSALWYYCLFAFLTTAALARSPDLLRRLMRQLDRLIPWLLLWLPVGLLLIPLQKSAPNVPFTSTSILSHKAGNAAIAALVVLGYMWLLADDRSARSRAVWSVVSLGVIALAATQNRGGLLGVVAGSLVGLMFLRDRARLVGKAVAVMALVIAIDTVLPLRLPIDGLQGRDFSSAQLIANVMSLGGSESPGNLGGTVDGRQELWSRVLNKQIEERLVEGAGFGVNLAAEVNVYDDGEESLRNPHNSHLNVLARMGVVGGALWVALWLGWYGRLIAGCRRLGRQGQVTRRNVAVWCLSITTAILVSSFFDPQLEGPQVAALLWVTFGIGVAVTSRRTWFGAGTAVAAASSDPVRRIVDRPGRMR
ncbi:O-antigen ligase family protein [Pseudonocardia hispaniensis]|uniref:O-antigen ligase family protein n=1 Tax=Pseudonocardia hispaniensis TaxID=904933 RepID=A0ABW1IZP4_9PSEU